MRRVLAPLITIGALAVAAPASAVETISLHSGAGGVSVSPGDYYFSDGTVTVRVSAWSIDTGGTIRSASLGVWDYGLGVEHSGDGNHTTDNKDWKDFLVFQFSKTVELEKGWFYSDWDGLYDTDATIGYRNSGDAYTVAPSLNGLNQSALNVFTQYASNDGTGDEFGDPDLSNRDINTGNKVGNMWLIGASFANNYNDGNKDGFKLKKLTYNVAPPPVPEPSTWALLILGFGGVGAAMRKRQQQALAIA